MAVAGAKPGEDYTIQQTVFKVFGNAFHIYAADGSLVGYCAQKAFRLRESLTFYTDESKSEALFHVRTRSVIDFSATYEVTLAGGGVLGSLRRRGLSSWVGRDSWEIAGPTGGTVAELKEDSLGLAMARRMVPLVNVVSPQVLHMRAPDGTELATFRKHFNLFVHRMGVAVHNEADDVDDLLILAAGCVYMAIDQRQSSD